MHPDPSWTVGHPNALPSEGLHEAVARTALARPDAVAVVSGLRTMTYAELDRAADAWAVRLAAAGVASGDIVPILLPRSTRLVIALLAVLKAGGAYALLDPAWPVPRLVEVIGQLGTPLLVSDVDTLGAPAPSVWSPPSEQIPVVPGFQPVAVDGSAPCCVFFTSGTTGTSKGVLTPHRATARLFQQGTFARFAADTVMPLAAPVPWDAFSLELWSVLLSGGTSVIVDEPFLSAQALRATVSRHGTDMVWLTSSLFNMIVDEDLAAFRGLRHVLIGGERLSVGHVGRFLCGHPDIMLLNGYGPVESTIFATTHRITAADCDLPGGIPLGKPVPGTGVHVLDGSRPCAVDEMGEICVSGDGLASRYLGDAALTAVKFTEVVIDGRPTRVYRTGDLGTWGADGLLHFRGRADRQLKVRGHRIEPAEIERQVERLLPAVRSCRVLARADAGGTRELVAFCVPTEPGNPLADALSVLRSALVPHQRPATVVSVAGFPVTAQGKLDERALLAMVLPAGSTATVEDVEYDDPTTRLVAQTFRAVLGVTSVPPEVPFTELGGTSLGAGRVCARLATLLARPVPVSRLYQHPTVTEFAEWLRGAVPATGPEAASADEVPLTPMQVMYLTRHLVDPADRTAHCLLVWAIEGELDHAAMETAIAAVHDRHEPLRAAYLPDPGPSAVPIDIPPPPSETLPTQPSIESAVLALRTELATHLEPIDGDVWRTAFVPVDGSAVTLFGCVVHHIAFDGWSESVLARDLAAAYNMARGVAQVPLPSPPPLSTVHKEHLAHMAHVDLAAQQKYLVQELTGTPPVRWPASPVGRPAGPPSVVEAGLAPAVVAEVDAMAARAGVSRFVVLLSHCASSLAGVTGQRDFAVGVPVAKRHRANLEHAIGCHIEMVCVRLRGTALDGGVAAVRETGRIVGRAFAAQEVPFGDVLHLVNPPRSDRPPLFQTLFALQDNATPRLDLAGLRTTFFRQPYLDLPLELHTELWPDEDGGLRLTVYFRPDAVAETTAQVFAKHFTDRLHTTASGARP